MKINCEIIRDLLPLYCDDFCSESSKKLVEEHLSSCNECCTEAEKIKSKLTAVNVDEEKSKMQLFKKIKKKITFQKLAAIALTVLFTGCALWGGIKIINKSSPIEYYDGLVRVYEAGKKHEIFYTGTENGYAKVNCVQFEISENGEIKKILCFYLEESIHSKYFKDKYSTYIREVQTETDGSVQGVTQIYYMIYNQQLTESNDALWKEIQENGVLLWKA